MKYSLSPLQNWAVFNKKQHSVWRSLGYINTVYIPIQIIYTYIYIFNMLLYLGIPPKKHKQCLNDLAVCFMSHNNMVVAPTWRTKNRQIPWQFSGYVATRVGQESLGSFFFLFLRSLLRAYWVVFFLLWVPVHSGDCDNIFIFAWYIRSVDLRSWLLYFLFATGEWLMCCRSSFGGFI